MDRDIIISIIVPIFNASDYLLRCLNSIANQSYPNLEIILIDDCSLDDSYALCQEYNFNNFKTKILKNKRNSLTGFTRNIGISVASGHYIWFVDADDWLELNAVTSLVECLNKNQFPDLILFGYKEHYTKETCGTIERIPYAKKESNYFEYYLKKGGGFYPMPFIYLMSRELLLDKKTSFPEGVYYEDIVAMGKVTMEAKNTVILPKLLYNYNKQNEHSITEAHSEKKIRDLLKAYDGLSDLLLEKNTLEKYQNFLIFRFLVFGLSRCFKIYENIPENMRKNKILRDDLFSYLGLEYLDEKYLNGLIYLSSQFDETSAWMKNHYVKNINYLKDVKKKYA